MSYSAADCRKFRGSAKGVITKISSSISELLSSSTINLDTAAMKRYSDSVETANDNFSTYHDYLRYDLEEISEDDYLRGYQVHQGHVSELRLNLVFLTNRHSANQAMRRLDAALASLELSSQGGFSPCLIDSMPRVKAMIIDFETTTTDLSLASEGQFIKARESFSTRLQTIDTLCRPHLPSSSVSTSAPSAGSMSHPNSIKISMPKFDGRMLHWKGFWSLFDAIMSKHPYLTSESKRVLLFEAMDSPDSKELAREALSYNSSYEGAAARLRKNYEDNTELLTHHVAHLLQHDVIKNTRQDLKRLLHRMEKHTEGIRSSNGYTVDQILATHLASMLSPHLLSEWKKRTGKLTVPPALPAFQAFIEDQIHASADPLDLKMDEDCPISKKKVQSKINPQPQPRASLVTRKSTKCRMCKEDHSIFTCSQFSVMTGPERRQWAERGNLCFNCLDSSHRVDQCSSTFSCKHCRQRHHTLLHLQPIQPPRSSQQNQQSEVPPTTALITQAIKKVSLIDSNYAVPFTAIVRVKAEGLVQQCRAHLDTGASVSLISLALAKKLRAQRIPNSSTSVQGINNPLQTLYQVKLSLFGNPALGHGRRELSILAHVVDKIPSSSSRAELSDVTSLTFVRGLTLADPQYSSNSQIDMLLEVGAVVACGLRSHLYSDVYHLEAHLTIFGWTIGGTQSPICLPELSPPPISSCLRMSLVDDDPERLLRRFWEVDTLPQDNITLSSENEQASAHFTATHQRDAVGRYHVSLPRRHPAPQLGTSRNIALRRFLANEKSLCRRGTLKPYQLAVSEYVSLKHAERVPLSDLSKPSSSSYYMPMHGVIKPGSTSTKLRPVCDASAKSSSGISLNDQLLPGPSLYPRIWSIINKFRCHAIAMTADISKMYRQVGLNEEERDFHRFLNRDEHGNISDYRMTRLTFGVSSSPFLATQVLRQLATDYSLDHPAASSAVRTAFYVDDLLAGADTVSNSILLRKDLNTLLDKACMPLCKWRSNSSELLDSIPASLCETSDLHISPEPGSSQKTLGVHWSTSTDSFFTAIPEVSSHSQATKRKVASTFAKIFDPLGWYGPATIPAKILLQKSWSLQLGWDDLLPPDLQALWVKWVSAMPAIHGHPIPRYFGVLGASPVSKDLHGFADASTTAYGGVTYLRLFHADTTVSISLVSSKSKLAPVKFQSMPRMELCGALILANLLSSVSTDLDLPASSIYAWCDSAIVLGWLNKDPQTLDTFVANRVSKIIHLIPASHWRYVSTKHNPADILSRGESPTDLTTNQLWWKGPTWLALEPALWPRRDDINLDRELPSLGPPIILKISQPSDELGQSVSNFRRLVRIFAWVRRFLIRTRKGTLTSNTLTIPELRATAQMLFKHSQLIYFSSELHLLARDDTVPKGNSLQALSPFLDDQGLLRVGGRLQRASLAYSSCHPLILHVQSHIVRIMVKQLHKEFLHVGAATLLTVLSSSYYIPRLKSLLRSLSRNCVECQRRAAKVSSHLMGQLPTTRITQAPVFSIVGVDFAGPFLIRRGYTRKPQLVKTYLCLFVCFVTKATHVEVVADMTTPSFLASLSRFVGRRGYPSHIYSDNGSNFIGAQSSLAKSQSLLSTDAISTWSAARDIQWHFSPARAPHFGGLWEANIRSMKRLLGRSLSDQTIRMDEFMTLTVEVEAILNSRPLIPLDSQSEEGIVPLTPGHFLVGRPLLALPFHSDLNTKTTLLRRWNLVERLAHNIWTRWKDEYLVTLHQFNKWRTDTRNVAVGDLVLVKDSQCFQREWPLGLITQVFPGADGIVRVADVRSHGKIVRRPVAKLVELLRERLPALAPGENGQVDDEIPSLSSSVPAGQDAIWGGAMSDDD